MTSIRLYKNQPASLLHHSLPAYIPTEITHDYHPDNSIPMPKNSDDIILCELDEPISHDFSKNRDSRKIMVNFIVDDCLSAIYKEFSSPLGTHKFNPEHDEKSQTRAELSHFFDMLLFDNTLSVAHIEQGLQSVANIISMMKTHPDNPGILKLLNDQHATFYRLFVVAFIVYCKIEMDISMPRFFWAGTSLINNTLLKAIEYKYLTCFDLFTHSDRDLEDQDLYTDDEDSDYSGQLSMFKVFNPNPNNSHSLFKRPSQPMEGEPSPSNERGGTQKPIFNSPTITASRNMLTDNMLTDANRSPLPTWPERSIVTPDFKTIFPRLYN